MFLRFLLVGLGLSVSIPGGSALAGPGVGGAAPARHRAAGPRSRPGHGRAGRTAPRARGASPRIEALRAWSLSRWLERIHRRNDLLAAARAALGRRSADLFAARWAWVPRMRVKGSMAPTPKYHCIVPDEFLPESWTQTDRENWLNQKVDGVANRDRYCVTTDKDINVQDYSIQGLYFKIQVDLGIPLSAFWKQGPLMRGARAALRVDRLRVAARQRRLDRLAAKAYYGVKLAREILFTLDEGKPYLDKALSRVEKALDSDDDDSDVSVEDRFRLKLLLSQIAVWRMDAKQVERSGLDALRALAGFRNGGPDVDRSPLAIEARPLRTVQWCLSRAGKTSPLVASAKAAVQGAEALLSLRKMEFWPDVVLAARYSYTYSNSDDPVSAYANDKLHGNSFFVGLQLRYDFDILGQVVRYRKAKAMVRAARQARKAADSRMAFAVRKAYGKARTAAKKLFQSLQGHKYAKAWLTAVAQKHDMGMARAKDLADALRAYFKSRLALVQVTYEYKMALAELAEASGLPMSALTRGGTEHK